VDKKRIRLGRVSDLKTRDDGLAAEFTLTAQGDNSVIVDLYASQLDEVIQSLIGLAEASRFNRDKRSETPKAMRPMRPVYLCEGLEISLNADGSMSFLISNPDAEQIQVLFPEHVRTLIRQVLTGNGSGHPARS